MRAHLRFLILDDFDPDTGELALRLAFQPGEEPGLEMIRLRLHLGRAGNPLDPLTRELRTHVQMPLPPLWEHGLRTIIHAIEEDLGGPNGRNALRYLWVRTQLLHPAEPARSTPTTRCPAKWRSFGTGRTAWTRRGNRCARRRSWTGCCCWPPRT